MANTYYKGTSFKAYEKSKSARLNDVDLVKQDLLNHIFTRRSERVMIPLYGTRIQDMLMEPLDEASLTIIQTDLLEVFNYDPRVQLLDFTLNPIYEDKAVVAIVDLFYVELEFQDQFAIRLEFES